MYNTLPHKPIKDKFFYSIKWSFCKSGYDYICYREHKSFLAMIKEIHTVLVLVMAWFMLLLILLNKISVRFGNNVFGQIVGIPVGTNIAPSLLYCWFSLILLRFSVYCQAPKEPQSTIWPSGDKPISNWLLCYMKTSPPSETDVK